MKRFELEINEVSMKTFFPLERIKSKRKILEILLETCRYILHTELEERVRTTNKIVMQTEKMNRIFFVAEAKIYSIIFPFNVYREEGVTKINFKNLVDIDSYTISNLISFIKNPANDSDDCLDFIEPITDFEKPQQTQCWIVLNHLLFSEDGYIRYDNDPKGYAEAVKREEKHKHPLHHLDIFYSNPATFKLGLEKPYLDADIIDMMNTNTDCKYIKH